MRARAGGLALALLAIACEGPPIHVAVLPDTQCYAYAFPEIFLAQGSWIREGADPIGIEATIHLGDITETNAPLEWDVAREALAPLYARMAMALAPGNHDLGDGGRALDRSSRMQDAFPISMVAAAPGFLAAYADDPANTAWSVRGARHDYLLVALEFSPRAAVRAWASAILAAHPDHFAIVSTHAYLDGAGRRYDHESLLDQEFCPHDYAVTRVDGSDGERLFQEVIAPSTNVRLVLSGHVPNGFAHSTDRNARGDVVHQVVVDYQTGTQCPSEGGDGLGQMLDLTLEDRADGARVIVRSFSPFTGEERLEHGLELLLDPV